MSNPKAIAGRWGLALGLLLASVSGCATRYIPNTDVEDTDENREVIKFCERYRRALELKDTPTLLAMASRRYYEDGGNIDPTDDMDFDGLKAWLEERFQQTTSIRYEVRYRRVEKTERNRYLIIYTYTASWRIPGLKQQDDWHRKISDNRLEIEPCKDAENDQCGNNSFRILAGM